MRNGYDWRTSMSPFISMNRTMYRSRSFMSMNSNRQHTSSEMSTVAPVLEFANLSARSLFSCALLKFVQQLWLGKFQILARFNETQTLSIIEYFLEQYPFIPAVIRSQVISVIERMGAEMTFFYDSLVNCHSYRNPRIRLERLFWTSQFTLDRVKTIGSYEKTTYIEGCKCCRGIMMKWIHAPATTKALLKEYFGKYSVVVFIYWTTYHGRKRDIEKFIHKTTWFREGGSFEEKLFKFFVVNGSIECFDYFPKRISNERFREITSTMVVRGIVNNICQDVHTSDHLTPQTVIALLKYLDVGEQRRIIQNNFSNFCAFLLFLPGVEPLIPFIQFYKPSVSDVKKNRHYLQEAASKISLNIRKSQQHRHFFRNLYTRTRNSLSDIDILHLLEAVLTVDDVETASMMVRMMEQDDRDKLLDAVPKVWNDLWKATIESETFFAFFFDVQAHSLLGAQYFKVPST